MFAVTVHFEIHAKHLDVFMPLMKANARTSLSDEDGCQRFDICTDPARANEVFLYELYDDAAAFEAHLASAHFKAFDTAISGMVASKSVQTFSQVMS